MFEFIFGFSVSFLLIGSFVIGYAFGYKACEENLKFIEALKKNSK
jgi:hypothetical protein